MCPRVWPVSERRTFKAGQSSTAHVREGVDQITGWQSVTEVQSQQAGG